MTKTGKKRLEVRDSAKLKIAIWADANKERLAGLTMPAAAEIIKAEFGAEMSKSAIRNIYAAIGVAPKQHSRREKGDCNDVRVLAGIVRNLMTELGIRAIPPSLDKLCGSEQQQQNGHHARFQMQ